MASSGKYDQRVQIHAFTTTRDEYNAKVKAWSVQQTIWAGVDYGSGGEKRVSVAQEQASQVATVYVRDTPYTRQIKPQAARIEFDGYIWDIESAMPSKKRRKEFMFTVKAIIK